MIFRLLTTWVCFGWASVLSAQSVSLSRCLGEDISKWNECYGEHTYVEGARKGTVFRGEWRGGKRGGYGVSQLANGGRYEGAFLNDQPHGRGVFRYANGDTADGDFFEGRFRRGIYKYKNGDMMIGAVGDDGGFQGLGEFIGITGERYLGEFKNSKYHGNGRVFLSNGDSYFGEFNDGRYHGRGSFVFAGKSSSPDAGIWENGKLIRRENETTGAGSDNNSVGAGGNENFVDCGVGSSESLVSREKQVGYGISVTQENENLGGTTRQSIGFFGGSVSSGVDLRDASLSLLQSGKSTIADVVGKFGKPVSENKASGARILTYMMMSSDHKVNAASYIPIFGSLLSRNKISSSSRVVYFIFDDKSEVLKSCKKMDSNSEKISPSVMDSWKKMSISVD